jgi:hypothetical protein
MPRASSHPKLDSFNFRVNGELKRAFLDVAACEDRPAGSILRDFMRSYVAEKQRSSSALPTTASLARKKPARKPDISSAQRGRRHEP